MLVGPGAAPVISVGAVVAVSVEISVRATEMAVRVRSTGATEGLGIGVSLGAAGPAEVAAVLVTVGEVVGADPAPPAD